MPSKLLPDNWKEKMRGAFRKPKGLMIAGLIGIGLIFFSTLFPSGTKREKTVTTQGFSAEEYKEMLESEVGRLVEKITGDRSATVVVTLDSGARYVYADSVATSSADSSTEAGALQTNNSTTRSYITVRNDSGGEEALPVTVYMPQIRGVAIVCRGGGDPTIMSQVESAVTAALHITTTRVYITGGNGS